MQNRITKNYDFIKYNDQDELVLTPINKMKQKFKFKIKVDSVLKLQH